MSNYNTLKATINANIKQNGNQEITGQILNSVLNQMVTTLGAGYQFAGIATTATNPGTSDAKVFYIANGKGTYTNFGGLEVTEDEVVVLYYDTEWHKVATGIASQAKLSELEEKIELDTTIIYALQAIYRVVPSQDIGADGDYALFIATPTNQRIYKKINGGWNIFRGYGKVLICAGNRVFYRKSDSNSDQFTEITTPIINFEFSAGIPTQSANEGDYILSARQVFAYNNAGWKTVYANCEVSNAIFRNGDDFYIVEIDEGNNTYTATKIINNSGIQKGIYDLQKDTGDLQKELFLSTNIENLVATASGTIITSSASDSHFYLNVTPLTTYVLRFKAQYTGTLALYASTNGKDNIGLLFEVKDTDFTSEYVAIITTPDNCNVIRTRTYLQGAVIDYISLYSVLPLNVVVKDIEERQKFIHLDWLGKVISTYGDSVTALNGGDYNYPYDESAFGYKWALRVANYFSASSVKNRGIGGQRFSWGNNGGSVSWVKTLTGEYVNRNESYNYDNYEGNIEIPSDCTPIRGALSSWLRITSMYPASIKDTIDVILVMAHNDAGLDTTTEVQFLAGDNTDPEWANSTYYQIYNGDYNINTVRGGIASTIMKLQAWMPNAVIVLMTPISGKGTQGELNPELTSKMTEIADIVKEMHNLMSIPCIDVYGTCGINGLNRTLYITDTIHPYSENGSKMIARAVIGGLKGIIPNM